MKNCLSIIFALNLLMIAPAQASERGLAAKSRALFEVISAIEAARYDLPVSYEVRESELPLKPEKGVRYSTAKAFHRISPEMK